MNKTLIGKRSDIPEELLDSVSRSLQRYTVGFYRVDGQGVCEKIRLLGSGTLVRLGEIHAVLTAHHVIDVLPGAGKVGFLLSQTIHRNLVDTASISSLKIARANKYSTDGPDLGAVIFDPSLAGSIAAMKSFYDLDKHRDESLANPLPRDAGVWFVHGFVNAKTLEETGRAGFMRLKNFCSFTGAGLGSEPVSAPDGNDYQSFPYDIDPPFCKDFGGISGGGLWQVPLSTVENGQIVALSPLLSGVVFYQDAINSEGGSLKCHARASVYNIAYQAIANFRSLKIAC